MRQKIKSRFVKTTKPRAVVDPRRFLRPALLVALAFAVGVAGFLVRADLIQSARIRRDHALLDAIRRHDVTAAQSALQAGANSNVRQRTPHPVLHDLIDKFQTATRISPNGSRYGGRDGEPTALMLAVSAGNTPLVSVLLKAGADPNARAYYGRTVLMTAAGTYPPDLAERARIVQSLLDAGARVDERATNGQTALMYAVQHDPGGATVRRLLAAGADVNARDLYGTTPLLYVAGVGDADTTRLLLSAGADVHASDARGETARLRAARIGHKSVVALLDQAGARK